MEQIQVPVEGGMVNCLRFGSGPKPVICFHGYGEDAGVFRFLETEAGQSFTFYSIDLPFHGKTQWASKTPFTTASLVRVLSELLPGDKTPLNLLGFSLGGRMALGLYEAIPERIERLVLLAPDGLKVNGWYWLATQTLLGNRFFALTMRKPGWFLGMLKLFNRLKLANASIFKFVNYYIGDARVRELLYVRWTSLRKIRPDINRIKKQINSHQTDTRLLYGKHDRIILSSVGEKFRKGIEAHAQIEVIDSGHQILHAKHAKEIGKALK